MLALQIERVRRARRLEGLVVATSESPADDAVAQVAVDCGTAVYRGAQASPLKNIYPPAGFFCLITHGYYVSTVCDVSCSRSCLHP
jgi:hypothetical protein